MIWSLVETKERKETEETEQAIQTFKTSDTPKEPQKTKEPKETEPPLFHGSTSFLYKCGVMPAKGLRWRHLELNIAWNYLSSD